MHDHYREPGIDPACSICLTTLALAPLEAPPAPRPRSSASISAYGSEELVGAVDRALAGLVGEPRPDPADVVVELEAQAVTVLGAAQRRILAGLVESIAQAVGLPGLEVDLSAGFVGFEAALAEVEDRVYQAGLRVVEARS
jgi:hypothetical protein